MRETEHEIRQRLGIDNVSTTPQYSLILDQSAHMDWDWTSNFMQYFLLQNPALTYDCGVEQLLTEAFSLLAGNNAPGKQPPYYYFSICEMGFFRQFVQSQAAQSIDVVADIKAVIPYLRIIGGGITSPDCLVSSGEGFLRNYLVGKLWLANLFPELLPLKHCWIPDDYGQDPELPVAVCAMGMSSVGFSRLPGIPPKGNSQQHPALQSELLSEGADFLWSASDNASIVFTHWMPGNVPGYFQGGALASSGGSQSAIVNALQSFLGANNANGSAKPPFTAAPANYVYMPLDEDFMYPIQDLLQYVNTWNGSGQTNGVQAVAASYDDFVSLVLASGTKLTTRQYNSTPYYTGYYMSRPELKILHYATTRCLLAAEAIGLLASSTLALGTGTMINPLFWQRVSQAWQDLVPSTHHDYICGTAPDWVTELEQIPLLRTAHEEARRVADDGLFALAGSLESQPDQVVLVNPSGVPFSGLVEIPAPAPSGINSISLESVQSAAQGTYEGGLVFPAQVPSLAYVAGTLSTQSLSNTPTLTITPNTSGASSYTLENDFLTVTISAGNNWGIASIMDASGSPVLGDSGTGNDVIFYEDDGNLYQFGNEMSASDSFTPADIQFQTSGSGLGAFVLEAGPVRVRLKTVVSVQLSGTRSGQTFVREYSLAAGEPLLRMSTAGAAPTGYSIMTRFPLSNTMAPKGVTSLVHGTPCHWTSTQPNPFWNPPIFRATHHFVLAEADETLLGAMYHHDVPAWAYDAQGNLLGCLLRNTPGQQRAAFGYDPHVHTLRYAFRAPDGLADPTTGQPLIESLNYVMPAVARLTSNVVRSTIQKYLPASGSIAQVDPPGCILAAKPGDVTPGSLILRLYQPTNAPQTLSVTLGRGQPSSVVAVTALEDAITTGAPAITITSNGFTIECVTALNTVQVLFA